MILLLSLVGGCGAWLGEYFNLSSEQYIFYKETVLKHLKGCLPKDDVEWWEKSVREKNMGMVECLLVEKIKSCTFNGYQNASAEYLRHLIKDAEHLCIPLENLWVQSIFLIVLLLLALKIGILIYILMFYKSKMKNTFTGGFKVRLEGEEEDEELPTQ